MSAKLNLNVSNLEHNMKEIRNKIKPNTDVIVMVKANAYGCGIERTVKNFIAMGIKNFGVALVSEGIIVKKICKDAKVIVTSQTVLDEDLLDALDYGLTLSMSSEEMLAKYNMLAKEKNIKSENPVHLKIDTGMTRLGFDANNIEKVDFTKYDNLSIEGIYTHLSSSDSDDDYTLMQLNLFKNTVEKLKEKNMNFKYIHALNSAAVASAKYQDYEFTHVRVGIIAYGYYPDDNIKPFIDLKPCLTLTAPIINIRYITDNAKISYSQTYTAKPGDIIATIQIGYADGLRRNLSNNANVYYKGNLYNIVGNICMDMCMIDITSLKDNLPSLGEEVEIFGENLKVEVLADKLNTINYEILSCLNSRLIRE